MTTRLNELHNALRRLDYLAPETGPGATRLYDSIAELSKSVTGPEAGRRALVILTDGDDNGSQTSLNDAIREAQLAGVAVYGVLYTHDVIGGVPYPTSGPLRPSGISVMRGIAKATGGRAFVVGTGTPIAEIFCSRSDKTCAHNTGSQDSRLCRRSRASSTPSSCGPGTNTRPSRRGAGTLRRNSGTAG